MSSPERPELRIGDAEREAAVSALGEHFAAGRLTKEEYDERAGQAWAARTSSTLWPLFADLPRLGADQAAAPPRRDDRRPAPPPRGGHPGWRFGAAIVPLLLILLLLGLSHHEPLLLLLVVGCLVWAKLFRYWGWSRHGHQGHDHGGHRTR